jgi:hypothetical protein
MTPFSLSDLGLTEEEIAALGLGDATPAESGEETPEAPPAEAPSEAIEQPSAEPTQVAPAPEVAPADAAAEAPAAEAPSEEPAMTPFSLSELGLTEEEIAALGIEPAGESAAAAPSEAPADTSNDAILSSLLDTAGQPRAETTPAEQPPAEPPVAEAPSAPAQAEPAAPAVPTAEAPSAPAQAAPPVPAAAPAEARQSTGDDVLDMFLHQLEAEPENDVLRLSVARAGTQIGQIDQAVHQYRYLIRHSRLLDTVVGELQDLIADNEDAQVLQRLHRTLGDAYSKQGRLREAIEEYSWTLGGPRGAR